MSHVARLALAFAALLLLPAASADDLPDPDSAPGWIDATYDEAQQTLWLTWADVNDATAYNVYEAGTLLATLPSPGYLDGIAGLSATVYRVTAVVDGVEGVPATLAWGQAGTTGSASAFAAPGVNHAVIGGGFDGDGDPCSVAGFPGGVDWECLMGILDIGP